MSSTVPGFYKKAIYNTFHGVIDVCYPDIRGQQNTLMFVKTNTGNYVAKFGSRDMVVKNCTASRLASSYGIRTPDISIGEYQGMWFECYPMITGKTLFEHIRDGMPEHAVKHAFDEILVQFANMDNMSTKQISKTKCAQFHDTAYEHAKNTNGVAFAHVLRMVIYMLNRGAAQNKGLYHSDITPKNVIVDDNGNLVSFLDIDSMAICDRNYAIGAIADKWSQMGFDLNELYDKCEYLTGRTINRSRINAMLNTIHAGKSLMFHTSKNKIR